MARVRLPRRRRPDAVELGDYARIARRGLPVVAVCAAAGAALGAVTAARAPTLYESTSTVLVADAPLYLSQPGAPAAKWYTMDTEAARLVSEPVLAAAREATGDPDVAAHIEVAAVPTTKVLKVTYRSADRPAAYRGAAAMTAKYLEIRKLELEERRLNRVEVIGQQLTGLNERLEGTVEYHSQAEAVTQRAVRAAVARQIAQRQTESRRVRRASVYPGQVLRSGGTTAVERPGLEVPGLRGAALGVLAGAVLSALGAARLGNATDVERLLRAGGGAGAVVRLRRRRDRSDRLAGWDPIASALLESPPGAVLVARTGRQVRDAESAVARELAGVLAAHGRTTRITELSAGPDRMPATPGTTTVLPAASLQAETGSVLAAEARHVVLVTTTTTHRRHLAAAIGRAADVGAVINGIVLVPRRLRLLPSRSPGRSPA